LNSSKQSSTPSTTESAAPDTTPAPAAQLPAETGGTATALAIPDRFAEAGQIAEEESAAPEVPDFKSTPVIRFKNGREKDKNAEAIREGLGNSPEGTSYVKVAGNVYPLAGMVAVQVKAFYYCAAQRWEQPEGEDRERMVLHAAWSEPQKGINPDNGYERSKQYQGMYCDDHMLTVHLLVPAAGGDYPAGLEGPVVSLSVFDTYARFPAAQKVEQRIRTDATKGSLMRTHPHLVNFPPRYRLGALFFGSMKKRTTYGKVSVRPLDVPEAIAVNEAFGDPDVQAALDAVFAEFDERVAEIKAVIDASPEQA
jgi:hypothetical protein